MDESRIALFWSRVEVKSPEECWLWKGGIHRTGYGQTKVRSKYWQTHRYAYSVAVGELEAGKVVAHTCDNPRCCNPAHLRQMTQKENMADMKAKGRACVSTDRTTGFRKLTMAQVDHIRSARASGATVMSLSRMFSIDPKTVRDIVNFRIWKLH